MSVMYLKRGHSFIKIELSGEEHVLLRMKTFWEKDLSIMTQ